MSINHPFTAARQPGCPRCGRAFTLVELLVVIGIIAVLISILLPALNRVRGQAKTVECAAYMRQIGLAWVQYQSENKGWIAPLSRRWSDSWGGSSVTYNATAYYNTTSTNAVAEADYRWFHYLRKYTATYKIFNCPTANEGSPSYDSILGRDTQVKSGRQDGTLDTIGIGYSAVGASCNYSYSAGLMGRFETPAGTPGYLTAADKVALGPKKYALVNTYVRKLSLNFTDVIILMDGAYWVADGSTDVGYGMRSAKRYLHQGKRANALFMDGHVGSGVMADFSAKGQPAPIYYPTIHYFTK